jgi:hypothetical protein
MRRAMMCFLLFLVPSVASAQWFPDPNSAVGIAAIDAWNTSVPVDPAYNVVEAYQLFLSTANLSGVAVDIVTDPLVTSWEINDVATLCVDFLTERANGDAYFAAAVVNRNAARDNFNDGWRWMLVGTSTGNTTAVLKFAACCANSSLAISKFDSAQSHYDKCFLDYTSLLMLRSNVRGRAGSLIP